MANKYNNFLMTSEKGREGISIDSDGLAYDGLFSFSNIDDFRKYVMTPKDYDSLPKEIQDHSHPEFLKYCSKLSNYKKLSSRLSYLDPSFKKTFEQLDLKKDEDVQTAIDYFDSKMNNDIDRSKIVDAKMVVEQSKLKNLSQQDIEDIRIELSKNILPSRYGKGFEEYLDKRWNDIKSQNLQDAQKDNKFLRCDIVYNSNLSKTLNEKLHTGTFSNGKLTNIDSNYIDLILKKEEELAKLGYTVDKSNAYLDISDEELEELGEKRFLSIDLPKPDAKLSMQDQIASYSSSRDILYKTLEFEKEAPVQGQNFAQPKENSEQSQNVTPQKVNSEQSQNVTQSKENSEQSQSFTQKLGKEVGIDVHNNTKEKQITESKMAAQEKELQKVEKNL